MCRGLIRNNIENFVPIESPNPWFSQDVDRTITTIREALAEQPAQQQEPWPEEPEGHIAGGVQPSTQQARWSERWYGSTERGWWINCGYERIAHLGTEVSSEEVRKIVDAHNATVPAQQQEPVAWRTKNATPPGGYVVFQQYPQAVAELGGEIEPLYTSPQTSKPLTDEQVLDCWKQAYEPGRREHDNAARMARAIEAAHGIKGDA